MQNKQATFTITQYTDVATWWRRDLSCFGQMKKY